MHERRAQWSFMHLLPLLFLLFLLQLSYGDYVVKEIAEPGRKSCPYFHSFLLQTNYSHQPELSKETSLLWREVPL